MTRKYNILIPKMHNIVIVNTSLGTILVINPLANISTNNKIKLKIANKKIHKMERF